MSKKRYTVTWKKDHLLAPEDRFFLLKAADKKKAVRRAYKKLFPWRDRMLFKMVESPHGHVLVWLDHSGTMIGYFDITEE